MEQSREYWNNRYKSRGANASLPPNKSDEYYQRQTNIICKEIKPIIEKYVHPKESILDFGGGSGRFYDFFSLLFNQVFVYDIAEEALKFNRSTVIRDLSEIPDKSISCIVSITVMQHITDKKEMIKIGNEFNRILGLGCIIMKEDVTNFDGREKYDHMASWAVDDYKTMFSQFNFDYLGNNWIILY